MNKNNDNIPYLWIHIKKCGGQTIRNYLADSYYQVDRKSPQPFITLEKKFWNDNLNNYRVPLGRYDNKRLLFAKKYLYSESEFSNIFKFAFVRNPYSRAVSMWKYLVLSKDISIFDSYACRKSFYRFLKRIDEGVSKERDRHFFTHTNPIFFDISDMENKSLLDFTGKLENLNADLNYIKSKLGLKIDLNTNLRINSNPRNGKDYKSFYNTSTKGLVEKIYECDIEMFKYTF